MEEDEIFTLAARLQKETGGQEKLLCMASTAPALERRRERWLYMHEGKGLLD